MTDAKTLSDKDLLVWAQVQLELHGCCEGNPIVTLARELGLRLEAALERERRDVEAMRSACRAPDILAAKFELRDRILARKNS